MRRRPDVLWRSAPGHLVLAKPDGTMLAFSGPAVDVWTLLGHDTRRETIVDVLAAQYTADRVTVAHDLEPLFTALVAGDYASDDG